MRVKSLNVDEILRDKANSVARKEARDWGSVNSQRKIKGAPFPVWWFDCAGHGGYVAVVKDADVARYPFLSKWSPAQSYSIYGTNLFHVYVFEEDCAWAVLEYFVPEIKTDGHTQSVGYFLKDKSEYDDYVLGVVTRWHPELLAS